MKLWMCLLGLLSMPGCLSVIMPEADKMKNPQDSGSVLRNEERKSELDKAKENYDDRVDPLR